MRCQSCFAFEATVEAQSKALLLHLCHACVVSLLAVLKEEFKISESSRAVLAARLAGWRR